LYGQSHLDILVASPSVSSYLGEDNEWGHDTRRKAEGEGTEHKEITAATLQVSSTPWLKSDVLFESVPWRQAQSLANVFPMGHLETG
jgi:hypothetical protein